MIDTDDIKAINKKFDSLSTNKKLLEKGVKNYADKLEEIETELNDAKSAREEIQKAAQKTQESIQTHFGDVVTTALQAVGFTDYEFTPIFEKRRNKTECDMVLKKGDKYFKPEHYVGGGVIDVCAFALRVALWKLEGTAPVLVFDEPFKLVSRDLLPNVSLLIKEFQKEFNAQIIIITHYDDLEGADKEFVIENGAIV